MAFLAAAVFGLIVIIRMAILGGASADGQSLRREEHPVIYWVIFSTAILIDLVLFYFAYREFLTVMELR